MMMVAVVRLLMLLLLMMMMWMLLMMLGRPCGSVRPCIAPVAPVQPCIPGVTYSPGGAVTSGPVNLSWRAGWSRMKGAGGHGEALVLIQWMVVVVMM